MFIQIQAPEARERPGDEGRDLVGHAQVRDVRERVTQCSQLPVQDGPDTAVFIINQVVASKVAVRHAQQINISSDICRMVLARAPQSIRVVRYSGIRRHAQLLVRTLILPRPGLDLPREVARFGRTPSASTNFDGGAAACSVAAARAALLYNRGRSSIDARSKYGSRKWRPST